MASGANQNFSGFYQGTGAEQYIGEPPVVRSVIIRNMADGSEVEWDQGFPQVGATVAGGLKRDAAGAATLLTDVLGVQPGDGLGKITGFRVGTDVACNDAGVTYWYRASN